ncbi:hypothetical protein ACRE_004820 [Hapsidospora chrysogenum ATCC 11550]|uniref:Uncharacterized protein n=1 Tax=Hapsidospora chrysogenum (strain ATCC 11550 / CBS 779.69 / DSM 880 / IAM 14645 / JCM 23072 / IMI 49137) TaxID=857340 RepID=A0A086TH90_HAPC1|nr:hypothetical protein ACRE_004820 [Hapsidospora chrysogenum ATCC 11550]
MASQQTPPKKPRLSLQIKTSCGPPTRAPRTHNVDPNDPTAFNTLSNAYVTAVERSTPLTAINTLQAFSLATPVDYQDSKHRITTPYVANYPESPLSAHPSSPRPMDVVYPSTMTATPPLSGTRDPAESKVFTFAPAHGRGQNEPASSPESRKANLRVATYRATSASLQLPYTQPQVLHSILRNSPLPPRTAIPPPSPRRQSKRLQEKAVRRVGYDSPLEQEIVTNKYTKSHIDLLTEEASPNSASPTPTTSEDALELALAFTPNELRDGGQTPGPFEETRRRVAGAGPGSPSSPAGVRKRKRREKKRRWVWTIGQDAEDDGEEVGGAVAALRAEAARAKQAGEGKLAEPTSSNPHNSYTELPTPSIESSDSAWSEPQDVEMTDCSSVVSEDRLSLAPSEPELDLKTPTAPRGQQQAPPQTRDTPIPELSSDSRRDTPVLPDQMAQRRDTPALSEYQ